MSKYILTFIAGAIISVAGASYLIGAKPSFGAIGLNQQVCTVSTVTSATVGNQLSSTIASANSRRAWLRIQQPVNATNTVTVSMNSGSAATAGNGLQLTPATTTSAVPSIEVGLATNNPYTGTITGITSAGSTTVLITACNY